VLAQAGVGRAVVQAERALVHLRAGGAAAGVAGVAGAGERADRVGAAGRGVAVVPCRGRTR
jgi:hypothetical protein